jgi:hypothetical protein
MSLDRDLLKIRQRIGNSFLRAFYPIDYRSNQNVVKNIDQLLDRETKGLRTLSSTTSLVSQKLSRTLNTLVQDMNEMQESLDSLIATSNMNDELMKLRLDKIENNSSNLMNMLGAMGMLGELLRRRSASKSKKAEAAKRAKAEEEAKRAKAEDEAKRRARPVDSESGGGTEEPKPETKPTEEGKGGKGRGKFGGKAVAGANILLAAYALYEMWQEIQALDPNMKKGEYRQALLQIVGRTVAQVGLAWTGAFVAATVAGALTGGLGAIPGFLVGLAGGALAQYAYGDSVDAIADQIVDYLYTGDEEEEVPGPDASIQNKEAPAPTPQLETPEQQTSGQTSQVPIAPPIQGPVPPPAPLPQEVDGPVSWPMALAPIVMDFFGGQQTQKTSASTNLSTSVQSNLPDAYKNIPQTPEAQEEYMRKLYSGNNAPSTGGGPLDNTAQIDIYGGMGAGPGLGTIRTASGLSTQVAAQLVPNFQGFVNALEATGYQIKSLGGYSDRNIKGKNKKSFHASGAAIDINPGQNPHLFGGAMQTDMPQNVAAIAKQFGLGWGGSWSSSKDTMHFSAASSEGGAFRVDRNTGEITPLAEGAKVSKPTLALIGEGGEPEYVVPQSKAIKFAHEMISERPRIRTKKHTHVVVVPILT